MGGGGGGGGRGNKIGVKSHRHLMERWGRLCISQNSVGARSAPSPLDPPLIMIPETLRLITTEHFATFPNDL